MKTFHVYGQQLSAFFNSYQQLRMSFPFIDEIEVLFHVLCMIIWFHVSYCVDTVTERASKAVKMVKGNFYVT